MSRIIIIEDDPDINALVAYNLRRRGYSVEQVFDGSRAMDKLKNEVFDIVVLDVMLPGIDGFDICRQIKDDPRFSRAFVIMITAKTKQQDKLYAHILGADYYFTKPFSVSALVYVVDEIDCIKNKEFVVGLAR